MFRLSSQLRYSMYTFESFIKELRDLQCVRKQVPNASYRLRNEDTTRSRARDKETRKKSNNAL